MCRSRYHRLTISLLIILVAAPALAEVPIQITYQGRVTDSLGIPVPDIEHDIVFSIYETDNSPTPLWTSGTLTGTPTDGLFSVHLGPIPADVFTTGSQRYLGIKINDNPEMTPRVEITSQPYAYKALVADTALYAYSAPASPDVDWTIDGNNIYHSPGNVGIGVSTPREPLVVGSDLGTSYEGNYIVAGAPMIDFTCGYKLGLNNNSHSTIEWYGDGPPFAIHTKENGTAYNNMVVLRGGKVGINNTWPEEKLTIGPNLVDLYGDFISIGNENTSGGIIFGRNSTNHTYLYHGINGNVGLHTKIDGTLYLGIAIDSGRVGIGNTEPEAELSIGGNVGSYYGTWLTLGAPVEEAAGIIFGKNEDNNCYIYRNAYGDIQIKSEENGSFYSGLSLYRTRLGVGIDGSIPSENLVVGKDLGSFSGNRIVVGDDNTDTQTGLVFGRNNSNRAWILWDINSGYATMGCKNEGTSYSHNLTFRYGRVGINTNTPSQELHVVGDICYTGSIGACSDLRYKRKVHTLDNALDKVSHLRGVSFEWKKDEYPQQKFSGGEQIGLVAQEVKDVVPQVVMEDDAGYQSVDYSKLTALLIEAVKELKTENEQLRKRIDNLERR